MMMKVLVLFSVKFLLSTDVCWAFPDFIREGYQSCKACHYDVTGGGPLTSYGRTIAEEKLSRWAFTGEGETFYGKLGLSPFGVAGDFRYLAHRYSDENVTIRQRFPMQKEISVTFDPSENVSFVGSAGLYGFEPKEPEYRRYYLRVLLKAFTLRLGRFLPNFGLNIPDHTKSIRELYGQGKETLNAEASFTHRYFELGFTRLFGNESGLDFGKNPRVIVQDQRDGFAYRAAIFPAKGLQLGYSRVTYQTADGYEEYYQSVHFFAGLSKIWMLAELQKHPDGLDRAYGLIGLEPTKGLWLKTEIDSKPQLPPEVFGTIQFFPRPHFEFLTSASIKQIIFIGHWYI